MTDTIQHHESDSFLEEVRNEPGGESVFRCVECGICTSGCPVFSVQSGYNPRKIIRMIHLGMRKSVLESAFLWWCASCLTCQERCPQGVRISDIVVALRNIAARNDLIPDPYRIQEKRIAEQGRIYEIDEFDNRKRSKVGLPEILCSNEEVRRLFEVTSGESP